LVVDTDVLIEIERSNRRIALAFQAVEDKAISAQTWMEWVQGARDKAQLKRIKTFLKKAEIEIIPIDQSVSHRAMYLLEEHGLKDGLRSGDALIAATALVRDEPLFTLNRKHFKPIRGLDLHQP
jgi:predicted nucleic acid-binding protein